MIKEIKRYIDKKAERELWARAAGRCQFSGCNQLLYKSSVTQESVNLAQKAHIYSFSEKGPRGWGPFSLFPTKLNDISNLMLMCHGCHKKIDQDEQGLRYSAELLISWKQEHELRVEIVTGIVPEKKSHVVIYGANIGTEKSPIVFNECVEAMFPHSYPASERPEILSMNSDIKDSTQIYWEAESENLHQKFQRTITNLLEHDTCKHFSIFALAPQPLLIQLGSMLTDKTSVETYQLHREPKDWRWQDCPEGFNYLVSKPDSFNGSPVLIISLSDHVSNDRVTSVLGNNVSIWKLSIEKPDNDFLKSTKQLSQFRKEIRKLMVEIKHHHGNDEELNIFPVMPIACAIEFGRSRMPKADMSWVIFDQNYASQKFEKALKIKPENT